MWMGVQNDRHGETPLEKYLEERICWQDCLGQPLWLGSWPTFPVKVSITYLVFLSHIPNSSNAKQLHCRLLSWSSIFIFGFIFTHWNDGIRLRGYPVVAQRLHYRQHKTDFALKRQKRRQENTQKYDYYRLMRLSRTKNKKMWFQLLYVATIWFPLSCVRKTD